MTKKGKIPAKLINIHQFPLRAEGKTFGVGKEVKGISASVIASWYRRGVLVEPPAEKREK